VTRRGPVPTRLSQPLCLLFSLSLPPVLGHSPRKAAAMRGRQRLAAAARRGARTPEARGIATAQEVIAVAAIAFMQLRRLHPCGCGSLRVVAMRRQLRVIEARAFDKSPLHDLLPRSLSLFIYLSIYLSRLYSLSPSLPPSLSLSLSLSLSQRALSISRRCVIAITRRRGSSHACAHEFFTKNSDAIHV
jgi:hypothetical protein